MLRRVAFAGLPLDHNTSSSLPARVTYPVHRFGAERARRGLALVLLLDGVMFVWVYMALPQQSPGPRNRTRFRHTEQLWPACESSYADRHHRKRYLVYTTDDLRSRAVDPTRVFGPPPPENRRSSAPIGKVGLEQAPPSRSTWPRLPGSWLGL